MFFSRKRRGSDVTYALRELLLARAQGTINAEEFEQRQAALHAALLMPEGEGARFSWRTLLLPILIVAAAAALYAWLGNPKAIDVGPAAASGMLPPPAMGGGEPAAHAGGDLNDMVKRLADKLDKDPNNGEGWALLGHSYIELRKHADAANAFSRAAALLPADAALLADWADAYVMSHDRKWDSQSRDIVKRSLAADPKHLKTLSLAGSEAFDRADYKAAIDYWRRLKSAAPADSMDAKLADANIQEATAKLTGKTPPIADSASEAAPPAVVAGASFITGTVTLSSKLAGKVQPTDTVFVVAKSANGSGPPLAVKRFSVADLPVTFRLDESSAMVPSMSLSGISQALLLARISKSGNAIPQPGDVQTTPRTVKVGTADVRLELGQ